MENYVYDKYYLDSFFTKPPRKKCGRKFETTPTLSEMRAAAKPGECPFCGDPLAKGVYGKLIITCGDDICFTAYQRVYRRENRRLKRQISNA